MKKYLPLRTLRFGSRATGFTAFVSSSARSSAISVSHCSLTSSRCLHTSSHSQPSSHCPLCDTSFQNWITHAAQPSHAARVAICSAFAKPERCNSMLSQLKDHIGMDFALVEESLIEKTERRQKRLRSSLSFLLSEKVLKHALPRIDPETGEWKVSEGHLTNAIVGAAHAKEALMDRLSRLSPRSSGEAILAMVTYMTSPRQWSKLFDMLQLDKALLSLPTTGESDLPSPSVRLPQEAKALVVQSLLGELRILHDSDRSHQVTNEPAVINRLVHHVLASHALDNILSELLHHTLEKVIEEGTPVWRDYQAFEAAEQRRMYRSAPPALHARPSPAPSYNAEGAVRQQIDEDLKAFFEPLHPIDSAQIAVSTSREKEDAMRRVTPSTSSQTRTSQRNHWHEVHRQLLFEHPTPPVDTPHAAFAPPYPRLEKSL